MTTYYVDPVNGDDANAGDSFAAGHPFKTLKKTFAAGSIILVAKSPETAAAGTVTATLGSVSVATTDDLTGVIAQYTVIRIGGDDVLYMVKAINSTTITLYRPYRGTTGSGKGLTYYTGLPTSANLDWQPTAMVGTAANPITVTCGVNTSTLAQDGFTILYGNNANYLFAGTWTYTNVSRCAMLYWAYGSSATITDCVFEDIYRFRAGNWAGTWRRFTVNRFVLEQIYFNYNVTMSDVTINDLETANDANRGFYLNGIINNVVINRWKNAGYATRNAFDINGAIGGLRVYDAVMDELASGCTMFNVYGSSDLRDVIFVNPTVGSGTFFNCASNLVGSIGMAHVNGSATDHRWFTGFGENGKYLEINYDASVYHTAAPSAKVLLYQSAYPLGPSALKIPCDAGEAKTISVWFRKNASYGSITRPTMRLRWLTGTSPNLVSNIHDVTMTDIDDTWEQVSYEVTPSVKGVVSMELIFQSANAGAIAWYDDIGVA